MELKNYSDWSLDANEAEPQERIRKYADYVRTNHFKSGGLNEDVEAGIADGVSQLAQKEGILTPDMAPDEQSAIVSDLRAGKPKANPEADAKFLLDHYDLDLDPLDPEVKAKAAPLRRYLNMRKVAPELVESDGILDTVNPLLGDADAIRAARRASVDRGDSQMVAVDESDGTRQIYTGPNTNRETVTGKLDSLFASGALHPADLSGVEDYLRPVNGGVSTKAELERFNVFAKTYNNLLKTNPLLGDSLMLDAEDSRKAAEAAQRTTGEALFKGAGAVAGTLVDSVFEIGKDVLQAAGVVDADKPQPHVARNLAEQLSGNEVLRNAFSPDEIQKFSSALVANQAGPSYRADRPGSGVSADALGNPLIARDLIPNKAKFEAELAASPLNEDQKRVAGLMRESQSAELAPAYLKQITAEDGDAVSALALHRATGGDDRSFVENWLSDPKNYSGTSERFQQFGSTVAGIVPQLALAIPSLLGNESATKAIIAMQKDQQDRQQYAKLFGDEFGLSFNVLNTVPQVATDILATIGTGAAYTGVKGAIRGGVRAATRAALKDTVSVVSREAAALTKTAALAGNEAGVGLAFNTLGKEIAGKLSTIEKMVPVGAVAFTRSAGASYAQIYNQLPADMSHAEKHKQSVGYAIATGIGTALTVIGMSALGRGGVENLATGKIRPLSLGDDVIDDATQTVAATGTRNIPVESLNYKQAKLLYEATNNAGRLLPDGVFKAALRKQLSHPIKNYFRSTLKGGWDEGLEETIDQGIQMQIEDAALDKRTPLAEKMEQYWQSFVIGGAMGGASAAVSQIAKPLDRTEVGMALDARMSLLSKVATDLRKAGSPATAESLMRELGSLQKAAGERTAKQLAEREAEEARKAAGIPEDTPSEKRFDNDMEEGSLLADLDGSFVHLGDEEGQIQIDGENAYFVPGKRKKAEAPAVDPTTGLEVPSTKQSKNRILLGSRLKAAAGVITKTPALPRKEDGSYFVNVGSREFRLPTVEEYQQDPDNTFELVRDSEGKVRQIRMRNLHGIGNPEMMAEKTESNKYRIALLAKRYGLDLTPTPQEEAPVVVAPQSRKKTKPVVMKGGQLQMPFIEGKLADTPAPVFDAEGNEVAPAPVGEGQTEMDFRPQQERDAADFMAARDAEIAGYQSRLARVGESSEAGKLFKARIAEAEKAKLGYSADAIQLPTLSPEQEAELSPAEAEWENAINQIRATTFMNLAEVTTRKRKGQLETVIDGTDVETQMQVVERLNDDLLNRDLARDTTTLRAKLSGLDPAMLDTLEDMTSEMESLLDNPGTLPAATPEYLAAVRSELDTMQANLATSRAILQEVAERQLVEDVTEASDLFEQQVFGDRDSEGWLAYSNRPDPKPAPDPTTPEAPPVIEEAEDDGSDIPPEDTPPPAPEVLTDRVNTFLGLLGQWQEEIKRAADRADASNPSNLSKMEREAALNELVKTTTKKFINSYGAELYNEIQQTQALADEARAELLERIAAADTNYKALVMRVKPTTRSGKAIQRAPETFLTPKNTRWSGKAIKRVRPDFFRKGTKEQELFGKLVASGASSGWKASKGELVSSADLAGIGRAPALQEQFNTTINGNVSTAFSNNKVDHIRDGGTFTNPNAYLAAKNRQLGEEVRLRYPETGTFVQTGLGWGYQLANKNKASKNIKTKVAKASGVAGILVPYTESIINGELTLTGVFTNNPATTRAQLAEGWHVPFPKDFKGKPNPSILVEDGVIKGTYLPEGVYVPAGANIPLAEAYADRAGVTRSSDVRQAGYMLFDAGFTRPERDPAVKVYYERQVGFLHKEFGGILHSNRSVAGARNPRYPYDSANIDDVLQETSGAFTQRLNEYRLAQNVTRSMVGGIRALKKMGSVDLPGVESYLSNKEATFADLDVAAQKALLRGKGAMDVVSLAGHSNAIAFVKASFDRSLSAQTIADGINALYDGKFAHGDPDAVLLDYARYLFVQTTSEKGKFRTLPAALDSEVKAAFQVISNRYAKREQSQGKSAKHESFGKQGSEESGVLGFMQEQGGLMFDTMGEENRAMLEGLMSFSRTRFNDYEDVESVRDSSSAVMDDALLGSHTFRVIDELEKTVSGSKEVELAFHEIAKRVSTRLNLPGLATLRGVAMVQELGRHLHNSFEFKEGRAFLSDLNQTPSGRKAAALLIVQGWLPPYTIREKSGRARTTSLPMMTPSEAKAAGVKAPASSVTEGEQIQKAIFTKTKEDIEKREAGIYGVDEGGLYLNKETRQQESEYNALRMAAVANLQEDLRDLMEEKNTIGDSVEKALREMQEAEADLAVMRMTPLDREGRMISAKDLTGDGTMTRRDAVENSESAMIRVMDRKATRISELNEEGDQLEAQAAAVTKAFEKAKGGGYTSSITDLWALVDSYPDTDKKARKLTGKPANFATKYGVTEGQAEEVYAAGTNAQRRAALFAAADELGKKHTTALVTLPAFARDLNAQAKIKFDQAAEMTREVEELSKLPGERTVLQVLSKWEKAVNNLKALESQNKGIAPQAKDLIGQEIKRLELLINNPAYPKLKELLYNHPSVIRFIRERRPDYKVTEYGKGVVAAFDQKVYEAQQTQLFKGLYPAATVKDMRHLTFRRSPSSTMIGGQIDRDGNVIPTAPSPGIESVFSDWDLVRGDATRAVDAAEKAEKQRAELEQEVTARWEAAFAEEARALKEQDMTAAEWIEAQRKVIEANPKMNNSPEALAVLEWDRMTAIEERTLAERNAQDAARFGPLTPQRSKVSLKRSWEMPFASMSTIDPALRDAALAANTEAMSTLGLKAGDSESMIGALKQLRQTGPPHHKLVADILLAGTGDFIRTVNLVVVEMDNGVAGLYDRDTNSVILNLNEYNGRGLADVLLHELLHAATVNVLSNPTTAAQTAAAARIGQLRQLAANLAAKQGVTSPAILHGLQSDAEFITYALTAPEFQSLLKSLRLPEQRNVWQRIVDAVLGFFGLDPAKFAKQRDAVEELLDFAKMGMAHRRTFTTDMRWDQHEADRVNASAEVFNFHTNRIAAEQDEVFAARGNPNKAIVREITLPTGEVQFTASNGFGELENSVVSAADADATRARYEDTYLRPATAADVAGIRYARASSELVPGGLSINPIRELEAMLPPGMTLVQDDKMAGVMGTRRSEPNVIRINGRLLPGAMLRGLKPDKARAVLRATLDEELAELAADSVMSVDDYTGLAASLEDSQRAKLEHSYYGAMGLDYAATTAKIAEDRASGAWTDADLGREWFRQHVTRMALGETREHVLDYKDSDPALFTKLLNALSNYISVLKDRLAAFFTNGTAARISQASRELRRLRNDGILPDPERAPAGELGDVTAFLNALDGNILPGQEDRIRFALPVYGDKGKVDSFWTSLQSRFYDMGHPELKAILDMKSGTNKAVEFTMLQFEKKFPAMRDAALTAGFTLDDIMLTFGTTAPMVSQDERKAINKQLKSEGLGWMKAQHDAAVKVGRDARERVLYDAAARNMATAFRQKQKAMEDSMRAEGFGEMVDFIIENREVLNKYKVQIGFGDTNDVYLTRTYRYFKTPAWAAAVKAGSVFTDPDTGETVDFGALRVVAADEMFKDEVLKNAKKEGLRLTKDELAAKVMEKLDIYLRELDGRAETSKTMDGVMMLRKDMNLLKTKKDLDAPLRHLLGEVKDPFEVYLRTLHGVSRYASNELFLKDFVATSLRLGLASRDPQEGMELLFPARKDAEYDELAGLHVRHDVANAIRDEFLHKGKDYETSGQAVIGAATRTVARFSGLSIFAKTSLGLGYWARNMISNALLTTAQGLNPFTFSMGPAFHTAWKANMELRGKTTEEQRNHIRRLAELQIVRDDANGRMVLDLMHGFAAGTEQQMDDVLAAITKAQETGDMGAIRKAWHGTKIPAGFNWLVEGTANLNNFVDSSAKINAYYQELAGLRASYGDTKTEEELEAYAARKVKLTFPTHSQQVSAVKAFNKSPLALAVIPFVRWKTEVLRTMTNTIPLAMEEINSGNANEKARGIKRIVGFAATSTFGGSMALGMFYMGINTAIQALAGGDDEEAEELTAEQLADLRLGRADWSREHDIVARRVGGKIQSVDMTYALPHSMVVDLFKLGTEGWRTDRPGTIAAMARYIGGEVLGTNIAFSGAYETFSNKDDFGNPIVLATDSWYEGAGKLLGHFTKATLAPSSALKIAAVGRAGETKRAELLLGEVFGGRAQFTPTAQLAERALRRLANVQREAVAIRQEMEQGRYFDPAEVKPTLDRYQAALTKNHKRVSQVIGTFKGLGLTDAEILSTAKNAGWSQDAISAIMANRSNTWAGAEAKGWHTRLMENKRKTGEQPYEEIAAPVMEWYGENAAWVPISQEDDE